MKIDLSQLKSAKGAQVTANKYYLHGNAGAGKSTLWAHAPKPLFIPAAGEESGIAKLAENNLIPEHVEWFPEIAISNEEENDGWLVFLRTLSMLVKEEHPFETIVIDCFDDEGFLAYAYRYHADKVYGGDMGPEGFMAFQNGFQSVLPEIKRATHGAIQALIDKGINVALLGHTTVGTHKNPSGLDYTRHLPLCNPKHVWPMLRAWADMVLFMDYETIVSGGEQAKKTGKGKAKGGKQRVIYTEHSAVHEAKNRHGLPEVIRLPDDPAQSWDTFQEALNNKQEVA